ncbi:histidine phosphatase family protein [Kitasatospora sp. NPDC127116]|uniref:histidine phosphatase family protein n=1 Tax=Kitasatospora sp. NPDC127116 TaxID=3345367 RepID=UPI0036380236
MADIWLMRHAAYQGHQPGHHAHPDAPLTDEGREQARHAARNLPTGITSIVTSTMPRARQTAAILAHHTGLPIVAAIPIFAEWRAPSIVHGRGPDTYPSAYTTWRAQRHENPELRCGDGESLADLHARATDCLTLLTATARRGSLLLISHALLLGVLTRLSDGPAVAFEEAAQDPWQFTETRELTLVAGS